MLHGIVHHVCDDHGFKDDAGFYYRFRADDPSKSYMGEQLECVPPCPPNPACSRSRRACWRATHHPQRGAQWRAGVLACVTVSTGGTLASVRHAPGRCGRRALIAQAWCALACHRRRYQRTAQIAVRLHSYLRCSDSSIITNRARAQAAAPRLL